MIGNEGLVRQGILSKSEALGRKVRSDKGRIWELVKPKVTKGEVRKVVEL
jgi:hypothetical protein